MGLHRLVRLVNKHKTSVCDVVPEVVLKIRLKTPCHSLLSYALILTTLPQADNNYHRHS